MAITICHGHSSPVWILVMQAVSQWPLTSQDVPPSLLALVCLSAVSLIGLVTPSVCPLAWLWFNWPANPTVRRPPSPISPLHHLGPLNSPARPRCALALAESCLWHLGLGGPCRLALSRSFRWHSSWPQVTDPCLNLSHQNGHRSLPIPTSTVFDRGHQRTLFVLPWTMV